jgi:hypothetical protein
MSNGRIGIGIMGRNTGLAVLAMAAAAACAGPDQDGPAPEMQAGPVVTYRDHVRPIWEARCSACHGTESPSISEFEANEEHFAELMRGPRMASYAELVQFVVWPDTGALMRRLDDGSSHPGKEPGNMYVNLGDDEAERQANLAVFKAWVGPGAWNLERWDEIDKHELDRVRAAESAAAHR